MQADHSSHHLQHPVLLQAAMYRALGKQTKLSRTGLSIVFSKSILGSQELSRDPGQAEAQVRAAGITLTGLGDDAISQYESWRRTARSSRRIARARFVITRPFHARTTAGYGPCNRVSLVDGLDNVLEEQVIPCRSVEAQDPDYKKIEGIISRWRMQRPDFGAAPVVNRNY